MKILDELAAVGSDINEGLNRLMKDENLYARLLKKFPASLEKQEVLPFIESGDIQTAILNAHTIKGVTGNLSLTPLYTAYTEIVDLLRKNEVEKAKEIYLTTMPLQEKILTIINEN